MSEPISPPSETAAAAEYHAPTARGSGGLTPSKIAVALLLAYLGIIAVEGFLRWLLGLVGLEPLMYLRDLLPLGGIALVLRMPGAARRNRVLAIIFAQLLFAGIVGLYFSRNLYQVLFGLKVFMPLLFGVFVYPAVVKHWEFFLRGCLLILAVAVAGVVLNEFIAFPWIGTDFTAFNVTVETSREWTEVGGRERLPGFSRASYDVATHIVFTCIFALHYVRRFVWKVLVGAAAVYAVAGTTSKVALACLIQLLVNYLVLEGLPFLRTPRRGSVWWRLRVFAVWLLRFQVAAFAILMVLLPLNTSGTLDLVERDLYENTRFHLLSMQDRAARFWPAAMEYITTTGSPYLGLGLGGVGTPLDVFGKLEIPITTDNGFLYGYGILGLAVGLYLAWFLYGTVTRRLISPAGPSVVALLALSICVQGVTKNTLESVYDCVFLGLVIAHVTFGWRAQDSAAKGGG